jgi:hypothetical protein
MVAYVLQSIANKLASLEELSERRTLCSGAWMVISDLNLILHASKKNNENLDRNMMVKFIEYVSTMELL